MQSLICHRVCVRLFFSHSRISLSFVRCSNDQLDFVEKRKIYIYIRTYNPKNRTINGTTKRDSHSIITKTYAFTLHRNSLFVFSVSKTRCCWDLSLYFTQWFDFIFIRFFFVFFFLFLARFCNLTLVTVLFSSDGAMHCVYIFLDFVLSFSVSFYRIVCTCFYFGSLFIFRLCVLLSFFFYLLFG